jgi:hypothetical protein
MCHEYADLRYLKQQAEERTRESVREPAPGPVSEPAGGLVAVLRGLVEKVRPAKAPVGAE